MIASSADVRSESGEKEKESEQDPPPFDPDAAVGEAMELANRGRHREAQTLLQQALVANPSHAAALFTMATLQAQAGKLEDAISLLDRIPADHPEAGLPALGQSADWCFEIGRFPEAQRRYEQLLEVAPHAVRARRQLANLLNRQGRRHEAVPHLRMLCRLGNIRQDELHALMIVSAALYNAPEDSDGADQSTNNQLYEPIGPGGRARVLYSQSEFESALSVLRPLVEQHDAPASMVAFYGRMAIEGQDDLAFQWWLDRIDESVDDHAEYWAAIGTYELDNRRFESATRALLEAIRRDPTDLLSVGRLRQALDALGADEQSRQWRDHHYAVSGTNKLNNQIASSATPNPDDVAKLSDLLVSLNRPLEAVLWKSIEGRIRGVDVAALMSLNEQRVELVNSRRGFPRESDVLYGMNADQYPLPDLDALGPKPIEASDARQPRLADAAEPHFENIASSSGLTHQYLVESDPMGYRHTIYQTLGGGVAAADFDLDGRCDLYFAQGGADPPAFRGSLSNQLFRQVDGRLVDVTDVSESHEFQYSIGITSGDWNQDGFPDLAISNIGSNSLLINNGDGTFRSELLSEQPQDHRVPSSIALADLDGDRIPDIYVTNYVDDPEITLKPPIDPQGQVVKMVSPGDFDTSHDQVYSNDRRGGWQGNSFGNLPRDAMPGLGVIATDLDGDTRNEIFVGNDLYPNQLWTWDRSDEQWVDLAPLLGCANGHGGAATGSMGIAAADFDDDGTLDLFVANYENENSSLFLQQDGAYRDRNIQFGLNSDTRIRVGFGSQPIDYDNDGDEDIVVTNGHLDDSIENTAPYRQRCQLFTQQHNKFQMADVVQRDGDYWDRGHLGRGLATLDFNRDGKLDFVVTHIGETSALMINQTPSPAHWLQLRLIGTESERDAIGARVRVATDRGDAFAWVIAGDGYLSHNESLLSFGLGDAERVNSVTIHWPSGHIDRHIDVPIDRRWLMVEGKL